MAVEWKTCDDFAHLKAICCDSCHQDKDMGDTMVVFYEDWDGVNAEFCCAILIAIDKAKEAGLEWLPSTG